MTEGAGEKRYPFPDALDPLTGVRFFLALGVVLFHYQLQWTLGGDAGLLNRARLGVDVFFILSGFILTHVYLQGEAALDYRRFLAARFARIYPAHLFILLAMLALVSAAPMLGVGLEPGRFTVSDFVQRAAVAAALGSTALLLALMQIGVDDRIIVAAAGPFILALGLLAKAGVRGVLSHPAVLFAGEASFALYLVHIPVLMVWRNAAQALFGLFGQYRMSPGELAALLAVTLAAAAAIHLFIERPGRRILRRRLAPPARDPVEARRSIRSDQGEPL